MSQTCQAYVFNSLSFPCRAPDKFHGDDHYPEEVDQPCNTIDGVTSPAVTDLAREKIPYKLQINYKH